MSPLIFLIGFLFIIVGFFIVRRHQIFFQNMEEITGTLIGIERYISYFEHRRTTYYGAVIEYVYDGQTYQFKDEHALDMSKSYLIGQSIPVCVSRNNPTHARLKKHLDLLFGSVFTIGGFVILGVALYLNTYSKMGFIALAIALAGFLGILLVMKIRLGATKISDVFTAFKQELAADKEPYRPPLEGDPDRYLLTDEEIKNETSSSHKMLFVARIISLIVALGFFYLGWNLSQDDHDIQEKLYISWGIMGISGLAFFVTLFGLLRQQISPVK